MLADLKKLKNIAHDARYPGDKELQLELLGDKQIKRYLEENEPVFKTQADNNFEGLNHHSLKVSPKSSPYLFDAINRCTEILDLQTCDVSVFIESNNNINAWCNRSDNKVTIGLNSGLINCMDFEELCFIIGHELGHAFYEHHLLPAYGITQGLRGLPPTKLLKLMSWSRQSEISADRAGMLCAETVEDSVHALMKLSTGGLGAPIISFDVDEFQKQVGDIDNFIDQNYDLMHTTHPLNPFRVKAIIEFSKLSDFQKKDSGIKLHDVNLQINEIIERMTPSDLKNKTDNNEDSPQTEKESQIKKFIVFAGYWVLSSDGSDGSEDELSSLEDICGKELVESIKPMGGLSLDRSMTYKDMKKSLNELLACLDKPDKSSILESLVTIARADGEVSAPERECLDEIASLLDLDKTFIDGILKFLE